MTEDKVSLCFDEDGNVRILDPAAFKHSEDLERVRYGCCCCCHFCVFSFKLLVLHPQRYWGCSS